MPSLEPRTGLRAALSALLAAGVLGGCAAPAPMAGAAGAAAPRHGKPVSEAQLAAWNIDVRTPDGLGLPAGSGTVAAGKGVFDAQCASCHGAAAAGGPVFGSMVGGIGSFKTDRRVLTPGSMYPYAPVLFDYVRRAMPMTAPQSLSASETYAVTGYILHLNGLLPAEAVVDAASLTALRMPNRDGFMTDDRPDTRAERCMNNCPPLRR